MVKWAGLAVSFALMGGVAQAAPPPVWVGGLLVASVSGTACDQSNIQVNEMYGAVYHPKLTGDGTVTSDVLQIDTFQKAFRFTPSTGTKFLAKGSYSASEWSGRAIMKSFTGPYTLSVSPSPVATTKFVTLSGVFNAIDGINCNVTFAGGLTLKK